MSNSDRLRYVCDIKWIKSNTTPPVIPTHPAAHYDVTYLIKELFACRVGLDGKLQLRVHGDDAYINLIEKNGGKKRKVICDFKHLEFEVASSRREHGSQTFHRVIIIYAFN